jgi:hypothetical protein
MSGCVMQCDQQLRFSMSDENEGRITSPFTQEAAGSSPLAPAMQACAFTLLSPYRSGL